MPANIAHMLMCHKTLNKIRDKDIPELSKFYDFLIDKDNKYKKYMNLGSMGPDLFYYTSLKSGIEDIMRDGFVNAKGVEPWSYHLHSITPNKYVLKLIEIVFRDAIFKDDKCILEEQDYCRLAFIAGYLTHIAADQIMHPVVNEIAGPYYRDGDNRKIHRRCELFQDYFLYEGVYKLEDKSGPNYDFFKQAFNTWCDCIPGATFRNTEDWFRYFIQRGFAETYNIYPDDKIIEDSVDNILLYLKSCQTIGAYNTAAKECSRKYDSYKRYIVNVNYMKHYRVAIELSVAYLIALYDIHELLIHSKSLSDDRKERFLDIVNAADLSAPLEKNILDQTIGKLNTSAVSEYSKNVIGNITLLTVRDIMGPKDLKKVVKA